MCKTGRPLFRCVIEDKIKAGMRGAGVATTCKYVDMAVLISVVGALICAAGLVLGGYGVAAPTKLLEMRKKLLGIESPSGFFDSHPLLERISSLLLAILCLMGLIKSLR